MRISRDLDQAPGIYIYVYSSIDGEFCITHQTEKREVLRCVKRLPVWRFSHSQHSMEITRRRGF
jgi:hypothetical protein